MEEMVEKSAMGGSNIIDDYFSGDDIEESGVFGDKGRMPKQESIVESGEFFDSNDEIEGRGRSMTAYRNIKNSNRYPSQGSNPLKS